MTRRKYEVYTERFTDFNTFLNTCDARDTNAWARYTNRKRGTDFTEDTYEQARELLVHGDADEVAKLNSTAHVAPITSIKPVTVKSVAGYAPIVPNAIIGLPNAMKRKQRVRVDARVVTLCVNIGYSADTSIERVERQGRALCSFIRTAERAGYRIALDVMSDFADTHPRLAYIVRVNVKRAEQPLDIKRVCYPLTHASMLRCLAFDWYERYPNAREISGYGLPLNYWAQEDRDALLSQVLRPNEHYVDLMDDMGQLNNIIGASK